MRAATLLVAAFGVQVLTGCAQIGLQSSAEQAAADARASFAKCGAENKATPAGQLIAARLWIGDGTDGAAKLLDPNPLTPAERAALVQVHNKAVQCRQIMVAYANRYAVGDAVLFQDYIYRSDAIFDKLESGELPVGVANKLTIESDRKLQTDLSGEHVIGVRRQEAERERATDALLQTSDQIAASLPPSNLTTTNCTWFGNTLNCTSMH